MLNVYNTFLLMKQQQVQIECINAYGDTLLIGTKQGQLFMYNIVKVEETKANIELMRLNKTFSKKPIQQLEVIPECNLLISLTDNIVQTHDLNVFNFNVVQSLQRTRGATLFAVDSNIVEDKMVYNLCVVVKRKLQLYTLIENEFEKLQDDINLVEIPKSVAWSENTICVGYRSEYMCYSLESKKQTDLFPTSSSRSTDPYIVKASDQAFALVRETQTVLVNKKGEAETSKLLKWSETPTAIIWDEPYCVAIIGDTVEVRTIESDVLLQAIPDVAKGKFMCRAKQGTIYIASTSQIYILQADDISLQRKVLLDNKQFQLAIKLTMVSTESDDEKKDMIYKIQTLLAYDLFNRKQFSESMKQFSQLETNPYDVIRLFPDLLPQSAGSSPDSETDELNEKDLEEGIQALIEYLADARHKHNLIVKRAMKETNDGNITDQKTKTSQQLLQIIDTTLLKCYLKTNDALVAPLLRFNYCHLAETERTLKKYEKHNELIILYQTKGQHRKALELLQSKENILRTITYLQHLGSQHIGLILEFADWVLKAEPFEGLKIFTEDIVEVEQLPRPRILDYLLRSHPIVVIPYLEHVVHIWMDDNQLFHNALIHKYKDKVLAGQVGAIDTRKKLLEFLETSKHYKPETVLINLPPDDLLEERAVVLYKLGMHEEALAIHVRALGDVNKAVQYCDKLYESGYADYKTVYVTLIKLLLYPDNVELKFSGINLSPKTAQPNLDMALKLLEDYGPRIDALSVIDILPEDVPVSKISRFLQTALHESLKERRRVQLLKGLLYAEHLQNQELRINLESQNILLTELNVCPVCKKRFSNQSALVRYPNGDVVHYSCQEKKL